MHAVHCIRHNILLFVCCYLSAYVALNLKDMLHVAHSIFMIPYMVGYSINYAFGLMPPAQGILLLVAGSFLFAIPPYLVAEWLSNKRSFSRCLVLPESHHNDMYGMSLSYLVWLLIVHIILYSLINSPVINY